MVYATLVLTTLWLGLRTVFIDTELCGRLGDEVDQAAW